MEAFRAAIAPGHPLCFTVLGGSVIPLRYRTNMAKHPKLRLVKARIPRPALS
jgi:hypothetical protein